MGASDKKDEGGRFSYMNDDQLRSFKEDVFGQRRYEHKQLRTDIDAELKRRGQAAAQPTGEQAAREQTGGGAPPAAGGWRPVGEAVSPYPPKEPGGGGGGGGA